MYVSNRIQYRHLIWEALVPIVIATLWSLTVVYLHVFVGLNWVVLPVLPVTLVGIAVSLYVAFKSASAYNRWWEARTAVGLMVAQSRELVAHSQSFIQPDMERPDKKVVKRILYRHLGWIFLVAHMLRRDSRLKDRPHRRMFSHRCTDVEHMRVSQHDKSYQEFLAPEECAAAEAFNNPPYYVMLQQAHELRGLAGAGALDPNRHVAMVELLGRLTIAYGVCERIKNTPFPRLMTHFGRLFTWALVFMLPLAFLDVFEQEAKKHDFSVLLTHEYVFSLVPFSVLISWIFLMMEKVSESHEDPFEGGTNDVPLSAIFRLIEIDVKQALNEKDMPAPVRPVDDTLY